MESNQVNFYRETALALEGVEEKPHHDKISFRIKGKIFATLNLAATRGCVCLSHIDQSAFSAFDASIIYPVPNKWGKAGWTNIDLNTAHPEQIQDILLTGYTFIKSGKKNI